jgi:hypothetical protein
VTEKEGPKPNKDEFYRVSTPEHVFVPGVGFMKAPESASITLSSEGQILDMLKARGFSEEAVAAFKGGKIIQMTLQDTPFGINIVSETWQGKEETESTILSPKPSR